MKPRHGVVRSTITRDGRVKHGKYEKLTCKLCGKGTLNLGRICVICLNEGENRIANLQLKEQQRRDKISVKSQERKAAGTLGYRTANRPKLEQRSRTPEEIERVRLAYIDAKVKRIKGPVAEAARVTGFTVSQVAHILEYYKKEMEQASDKMDAKRSTEI